MPRDFSSFPVRIKRVDLEGKVWIGVELPQRKDFIALIRQIEGRIWKREFKLWLVPYSKEAYKQLKAFFPDLTNLEAQPLPQSQPLPERLISAPAASATKKDSPIQSGQKQESSFFITTGKRTDEKTPADTQGLSSVLGGVPEGKVKVAFTPRKIILQLKKHETDIRFLRSLQYARWDPTSFTWQVSYSETNRSLILSYFSTRLEELILSKEQSNLPAETGKAAGSQAVSANLGLPAENPLPVPSPSVEKNTLLLVHYMRGRMRMLFRFDASLVALIKTFPGPADVASASGPSTAGIHTTAGGPCPSPS